MAIPTMPGTAHRVVRLAATSLMILTLGSPLGAEPIRLSTDAFGEEAVVEVRDLPPPLNEEAARAALAEILRVESQLDPAAPADEGAVARLNAAAGDGPQAVDGELLRVLARALEFCIWSEGAVGPLGGPIYRLWGLRDDVEALPTPQRLNRAVDAATCDHLPIDGEGRVSLAAGAQVDLWPFATGWAVDRAVAALREHGATNAFVRVAGVRRGLGPGPGGNGWRVLLPVFTGFRRPLGEVWLQDDALAIAHFEDRFLRIGGEFYPPYIDHRSGRPTTGVVAVVVVTDLGLDARALASALFATGSREGRFLAGKIRPVPSVRWLLGTGSGRPLVTDYNWSKLATR